MRYAGPDLGMFNMFDRTGAPTHYGPHKFFKIKNLLKLFIFEKFVMIKKKYEKKCPSSGTGRYAYVVDGDSLNSQEILTTSLGSGAPTQFD